MTITYPSSPDLAPGDIIYVGGNRHVVATVELITPPETAHGPREPYWMVNGTVRGHKRQTWTKIS